MRTIYPAIFKKDTYSDGTYYVVHFPGFMGACTSGETLEEALMNAKEVLALYVYDQGSLKEYDYSDIKLNEGEICLLVEADSEIEVICSPQRSIKANKSYFEFLISKAEEKNLTLKDVEFIIGFKKGYFKNMYKQRMYPSPPAAKRIGKLLDIDYKLLLK